MICIATPALDDVALLMYLDNEAEDGIIEHVEQCARCRLRAKQLADEQTNLTAHLFRQTDCPSTIELGEYHLGALPQLQFTAIAQHLDTCLHCAEEVVQLERFMVELAPSLEVSSATEPAPKESKTQVLVAKLVEGFAQLGALGGMQPAFGGVRGEEEEQYTYQVGDIEINLEVEEDINQPDRKSIFGLLTGLDDPSVITVSVWKGEEQIASVEMDEIGNFIVPELMTERYTVVFEGPETEIRIPEITL